MHPCIHNRIRGGEECSSEDETLTSKPRRINWDISWHFCIEPCSGLKQKDVDTKLHHRFAVTWECTTSIIGPSGRMRTHSGGEKKRCGFGRKGNTNRRGINITSERAKWKGKRGKCELVWLATAARQWRWWEGLIRIAKECNTTKLQKSILLNYKF